jgi:hypothetical protein
MLYSGANGSAGPVNRSLLSAEGEVLRAIRGIADPDLP